MAMKIGRLRKIFYMSESILIPSVLLCSATCPLINCSRVVRSDEAAIISGGCPIHFFLFYFFLGVCVCGG